ncbi:peptidoglycan DD-metalloendopeptidase family protein [Patescibacteria group bacterium]|nr:peptidoglycan DD-metalloendopeptidase family protein [Patescibacteria group bacterium]
MLTTLIKIISQPVGQAIWRFLVVWPYDFYLRWHRKLRQGQLNFNLRLVLRSHRTILIALICGGLLISLNNLQAKQTNRQLTAGQNNLIYPLIKNEFDGTIIDDNTPGILPPSQNSLQLKADNTERGVGIPTDLPITLINGTSILKPNIIHSQISVAKRQEIEKYTVETGDTLASIAKKFGLSLNTLLWENNLRSGSLIRPGQNITILPINGLSYKIRSGDTLSAIASRYRVSIDAITEANPVGNKLTIGQNIIIPGAQPLTIRTSPVVASQPGQNNLQPSGSSASISNTKLQWPTVRRKITQYYSWRHTGLDIADKVGTPLYAAEDGVVTVAGWNRGGYGYYIIIDHGGGLQTLYGHNSKLFVSVGEKVNRGQEIAAMGSTGRSTGPHIHFEVRLNGRRLNPLSYTR